MIDENLSIGIAQVLDVLEHMDKAYKDKISRNFMNFLEENKNNKCEVKFDHSKKLSEIGLNEEAKTILSVIYMNFWCTSKEKKEYVKKIEENQAMYNSVIEEERVGSDDIFKNQEIKNESENNEEKHLVITVKEKNNMFSRAIQKIKAFLKGSKK